ncbi:hypothetical protein CSHISOI_05266, partial [Colletotrichum shisoi]
MHSNEPPTDPANRRLEYSAKIRREYELPVCSTGDRPDGLQPRDVEALNGVSLLEEDSPSFLFSRQVVGGDDYSCGPDRPWRNGACCPKESLQCNYDEEYVFHMGLLRNDESNCDQPGPKDKDSEQLDRVSGYYEAWRYNSECQGIRASTGMMVTQHTAHEGHTHQLADSPVLFLCIHHLDEYNIVGMDGLPSELFSNFTNLKKNNPSLKIIIAIGGWTHNDPGPLQKVFSDMEYPSADDRGGMTKDGVNFTQFLKELKEENKKQPKNLHGVRDRDNPIGSNIYGQCEDAVTEGEHTVSMVCTDSSEKSNCHKIRLGHGVPGTILQMSPSCSPGKCAVAKNWSPPRLEEEFRDDYHFGGLEKRDLHQRWFGTSILEWLAQLVKPEIKCESMHRYDDTLTAKLIDETWSFSKGDVSYEGHLLAQALLKIKVKSSFGFALIISKLSLPLDLSQSYLTFWNKDKITGVMTLENVAKVFYEKKSVILNIPFPGASFKVPGIATVGPRLTVEDSIDGSLAVAGTIETNLEISKWEVRQVVPVNNDDTYKPKEIGEGDTSLDRTGDFEGSKKPEFYAGVAVQGDFTARLSAAAEFGIRFDERWEVEPAAAAVVGDASIMAKLTAGVSTNAVCPFTYSLDVGARLYARVQAPRVFGWSGGEYDLTSKWNKGIIEAGTSPDLGAIPFKRDLVLVEAGNYSAADRHSYGLPSQLESAGSADHNGIQRRSGHLAKRGSVHGPVLSLPVGKFFCPPSNDTRDAVPDDDDRDDVEGEILAHILERTISRKPVKACGLRTTFNYPTDDSLATGALIYGWEQPDVCGNYDWGGPLNARVAGKSYHSEHILEDQMLAQFFADMDERTDLVVDPDPNASPNRGTISFCDYVNVMFDINAVATPGIDTAQDFAAQLTPINHLAAQFPPHQWKTDEYVALESVINTPAKGKAWGTDDNIINTSSWLTDKLPNAAGARAMLKSMRSLIGSRLYHNDWTVLSILRLQKGRVGAILGLLDTT